jgi:hypothetical protein
LSRWITERDEKILGKWELVKVDHRETWQDMYYGNGNLSRGKQKGFNRGKGKDGLF